MKFVIKETHEGVYAGFKERLDDGKVKEEINDKHIYKVRFSNPGGLIMPLIVKLGYKSGKEEKRIIPAEVWRRNEKEINKVFILDEQLDPDLETADIDVSNNGLPRQEVKTKFEIFKGNG